LVGSLTAPRTPLAPVPRPNSVHVHNRESKLKSLLEFRVNH
jgi:hypothetical protein